MTIKRLCTWSLLNYCAMGIVYADKILGLKIWYIDNLIMIYFVWNVICLFGVVIGVIALIAASNSLNTLSKADRPGSKIHSEYSQYVKTHELANRSVYRVLRTLTLLLSIGYGVIGCWWFFGINTCQNILAYVFFSMLKSIAVKIKEILPELKTETKVKTNKALESKFKCIVAAK